MFSLRKVFEQTERQKTDLKDIPIVQEQFPTSLHLYYTTLHTYIYTIYT